jgi:hypothetical protein
MSLNNNDQARVRDYLLGHLSPAEQQQIEERLMVEDDLFQELEISKSELIEEYRAGELSEDENRWFESHYLASSEGAQSYTFAVALSCLKHSAVQPQPLTWSERLLSIFKQPRWAFGAVATVLVAVMVGVLLFNGSRQTNTLAVTLAASANSRSASDDKFHQVHVKPDVGELNFSLKLPDSVAPSTSYRLELDDRSGRTKTLKLSTSDSHSVSVIIPRAELPPGLYALKLFGIAADGTDQRIGDYYFQVTN